MAASLSHISIIGNVGKDPVTRTFDGGSSRTSISVAVSGRKKDSESVWYNASFFGKLGEVVQQYVTKGMKVFVSGDFEPRPYDSNSGETRVSYDINGDHINFLSPKSDDSQPAPRRDAKATAPAADDEELPF